MPGILIGYAVIRGCNITTNLKFEMIKMLDLRKEKMQFFMQLEQSVGGMMQQSFQCSSQLLYLRFIGHAAIYKSSRLFKI